MKITNPKIKLGIDWVIKKDKTVDQVANTFHVSSRRIEQLVKIFEEIVSLLHCYSMKIYSKRKNNKHIEVSTDELD